MALNARFKMRKEYLLVSIDVDWDLSSMMQAMDGIFDMIEARQTTKA